ncbi:MAG: hypothetical protein ACO23O_09040, partial [Ilumatobacteraceae bacterium]
MPVLAAGGLLAAVIGVGIVSGGDDDTAPVPTGSGQVTPVATFDTGVPETVTADDQVVIGNAP